MARDQWWLGPRVAPPGEPCKAALVKRDSATEARAFARWASRQDGVHAAHFRPAGWRRKPSGSYGARDRDTVEVFFSPEAQIEEAREPYDARTPAVPSWSARGRMRLDDWLPDTLADCLREGYVDSLVNHAADADEHADTLDSHERSALASARAELFKAAARYLDLALSAEGARPVPNLDAMAPGELRAFAASMPANAPLARYCRLKARAMAHRLAGRISTATDLERELDRLWGDLPPEVQW